MITTLKSLIKKNNFKISTQVVCTLYYSLQVKNDHSFMVLSHTKNFKPGTFTGSKILCFSRLKNCSNAYDNLNVLIKTTVK